MSKWIKNILLSEKKRAAGSHISTEDMAQFIEGSLPPQKRQAIIVHVNSCSECYELLHETLKDIPDKQDEKNRKPFLLVKISYAVAASLIFFTLISFGIFHHYPNKPDVLFATFDLTPRFQNILLENDATDWKDPDRIDRFAKLLKSGGLAVGTLSRVVISEPYYASKDIFNPDEVLKVRIENGTATVEIIKKLK